MTEETIFATALEKQPAERTAYLADACGGDTAMRKRLEGMLAASDKVGQFMARPVVASADSPDGATEIHDGGSTPNESTAVRSGSKHEIDDYLEDLAFLTPSKRPDSLGRIGHYEVLQVLGKGGFGIVFRAFDEILQRVVAVKVMAPQMAATSPARKRFLREARTSAAIRHENVVQVHEVAEQPLPFLVMEFIPGETLQQRMDRVGPLDVDETLRIGRQIAEGLAAAHATDLIHRDIKPGNVLIESGQHRVKITDFGLARAADDASISQSGIIAGTPMYMAPEQALGHKLDQRADLFSLGSVLYQMVAGRAPFRANGTVAVLKRVAEDTPRDIREIIPETPQWLCDIISKLHAKNPDERYQSAREVADVLADCESQLKSHARLKDFSRIPRSKAQPSGRRKWVTAAAVLLLPVLALAVTEFAGVTHLFQKQQPTVAVTPKDDPKAEPPTPLATNNFGLAFDGKNNRVKIPSLKITEAHPLTVEAWAVVEDRADGQKYFDLVANSGEGQGFALGIPPPGYGPYGGEKWAFNLRQKSPDTYVHAWEKQPVPHNQLIHVAGIYDGKAEIRFYVNGQLQSRTPIQNVKLSTYSNMRLGANDFGGNSFLGRMNEVRISKVARYDVDFTPARRWEPDANTIALYHFGEGEGTVLKDSSGNRHHGEIMRAKWVKADGSPIGDPSPDAKIPLAISPFDAVQAKNHQDVWAKHLGVPVEHTNSIGMKFRLIPPGEFMMGSADDDTAAKANEKPLHKVRLTRPMLMGVHEVTVGQFRAFVEATGYKTTAEASGKGGTYWDYDQEKSVGGPEVTWATLPFKQAADHPVCCVSWNDAQKFCEWLSRKDGRAYTLPTEAQWEFACRAGTTTATPFGSDVDARTNANIKWKLKGTCAVGSYPPNAFGLYDMIGNVYELCQDDLRTYGPDLVIDPVGSTQFSSLRPQRGGGYSSLLNVGRSANRDKATSSYAGTGFRVIAVGELKLPPVKQEPLPPTFKNSIGMEFVKVPKGKSWLSGGKDKLGDQEVEIPADFYLGQHEVMQEEWEKVMGENPSHFSRTGGGKGKVTVINDADLKRFPVESVSWDQCQVFVAKLNQREKDTGWVYRLPNEAEWEYACRGGPMSDKRDSAFDFYFANPTNTLLPDQANVNHDNGLNRTCKVGSYAPNVLGLYDMYGNVSEWCDDSLKAPDGATLFVVRSNGWSRSGHQSNTGSRIPPQSRNTSLGLRLARVPSGAPSPAAKTPPDTKWKWIDPLGDCRFVEKDGRMTITVPGGFHDLNPKPEYNLHAPRVLREVEGDFEARVTIPAIAPQPMAKAVNRINVLYVAAGLVVWRDEGPTFLRFMRGFRAGGPGLSGESWSGTSLVLNKTMSTFPEGPTQLRIRRTGGALQLAWSRDGQAWTEWATTTVPKLSPRVRVGVAVVNASDQEFAVEFEGFTLQDARAPIAVAPFTDADVQRIAALPAAEQVEEVRRELVRRNPGFDGKVEHKIEDGVVTEFKIVTNQVKDLAPIRVFTALRVLDCTGTVINNKPTGQLEDLTPLTGMNLAGLTALNLSGTQVGDAGLAPFKDCKNLQSLRLHNTKVTDTGLACFKDCKDLRILNLTGTQLSEVGLAHFKDCKNLAELILFGTQVGDAGLAHFKDCKDLTILSLAQTRVSDAGLAHFKDCKNLAELGLFYTQVGDAGLAHFKDCKNLTRLVLSNTRVGDAGVAHFKDFKNLTHLHLNNTQVSDASLNILKSMPLKVLWIAKTGITDLNPLRDLPLEEMRLTPMNITQGLDTLRDMKSVKAIGIHYNPTWPAAEFWARYDKGEFKE